MNKDLEILKRFLDRQKNDISKQGYKDDSPYRNNPSNTIYGTPQGTPITMKGVSTPLIGMDEFGNKQHMMPGQEYQFPGSQVTEMPIAQVGKNITESTSVYKKPFNDKELKNILKDNKELVRTGDIKNPRAEANKFEKYLPTKETANFFKKLKKDVGPELFKEALKIQHERGNPAVNVGTNKGLPFHNKRNYNPFTNEVNIPKPLDDTSDLKNYLKEVAHAGQPLSEVIPRFLKNDIPGYIKAYTTEGDSGDNIEQYVYDNPNTVENYTHHIIQPKLEERVYSSFKIPMSEAEEAEDVELYRQYFNKPMYQMGGTGMMYADRNYQMGGNLPFAQVGKETGKPFKIPNERYEGLAVRDNLEDRNVLGFNKAEVSRTVEKLQQDLKNDKLKLQRSAKNPKVVIFAESPSDQRLGELYNKSLNIPHLKKIQDEFFKTKQQIDSIKTNDKNFKSLTKEAKVLQNKFESYTTNLAGPDAKSQRLFDEFNDAQRKANDYENVTLYKKILPYSKKLDDITEKFYDEKVNPVTMDSTFIKEGENVKKFYNRTQPGVKVDVVPLYKNKKLLQDKLKGMTQFDKVAFFAHSGQSLSGIPNDTIAKYLDKSKVKDCYFGSCYYEEYLNNSSLKDLKNKTLNYRPGQSKTNPNFWYGFNPDAKTFDEGMWSRTGTDHYNAKVTPIKQGVTHIVKKSQEGGDVDLDAMRGMMKSKIGMGNAFGHPAIKRMSQFMPKTGMTPEGVGTHYMGSVDNYARPYLQDTGKDQLEYFENPRPSREDIRFNSPEEAQYFAEHYKDVAPMMRGYDKPQYAEGGPIDPIKNKITTPATKADSLAVFNNTKAIEDYFKKQGYTKEKVKDSKNYKEKIKSKKEWVNSAQKYLKEAKNTPVDTYYTQTDKNKNIAEEKKYLKEAQKRLYETIDENNPKNYIKKLEDSKKIFETKAKDVGRYVDEQNNLVEGKPSVEKFYLPVDENKFYQREQSQGFLDLRSPMPLYDKRINPQDLSRFKSPHSVLGEQILDKIIKSKNQKEKEELEKQMDALVYSDNVEMYEYDPLAVMPFDMVPAEQQEERIRKYGTSGVPASFIQQHPDWITNQKNTIPVNITQGKNSIQSIQNNLQPAGLVQNSLNTNPVTIQQPVRVPKYYDIEDYTHGSTSYSGNQSNYRTDDLSTLSEQSPNNTRKITPHYQEGGLKKKKIVIPDERYEGFVKKDNVPSFKINVGRPLSQQQVEQKRLQALKDKQGTFSTAEPAESTLTHALNIATLPLTALKYKMQQGYVPDNLVRGVMNNPGELNPYDLAYLATIARAVPGAGMAAQPLVQPLVSAGASALGANAFGVAGLNAANAIGAGFATHGAMNIGPDTSAWIDKPSWEKAGAVGWDILDMAPAISASAKTIGEGFNLASNAAKSSANAKVIPGIKPRSLPEKLVPIIEHDPTKHTHTTIRFKDPKNPHGTDYGYLGLENKTEWLKDANGEYIRDVNGMPQKSTVEWLKPSMISVDPKLQGNRLQDVLYQLGIDEAYKQKLSGIISGETLLSPQKTSKAHERFNRVVFDSKLSFPREHFSTRSVAVPHDIVGLTGHKNPNVVSDWMNNYKTINKHFPRRYHSLKDIANAPLNWAKNNKQDAFLAGAGSATLGSIGYLMDKVINNEDLYGRSSKEVSDEFNEKMRILNLRDEIDSLENNYKSVKNIDTKQVGGEKTVKYGTPEYEAAYNRGEVITEDGQRSPILLDEVVVQQKLTPLLKAKRDYGKANDEDAFVNRKKDEYIKSLGNSNWFNADRNNFPESVSRNINAEYNYNKNTKAIEDVAKAKGFNLNTRGNWIYDLTPSEKKALINSKYSAQLNPNEFAEMASGVQQLANTMTIGKPWDFKIPGLTERELEEDRESSFSGLKTFAPLNMPGNAIANYLKNSSDYVENPYGGVQRMGNVDVWDSMAMNPLNLSLITGASKLLAGVPGAVRSIPNVVKNIQNIRNINTEGQMFRGINNELNNMAIKNTENYMSKRLLPDTPLPEQLEPFVSRISKSHTGDYIPFEEDEYMKWFNAQKNKNTVVTPDKRSAVRNSSFINLSEKDLLSAMFNKNDINLNLLGFGKKPATSSTSITPTFLQKEGLLAEQELARANADAATFSNSPFNKQKLQDFRPNQEFNVSNQQARFIDDPVLNSEYQAFRNKGNLDYPESLAEQLGHSSGDYLANDYGDLNDIITIKKNTVPGGNFPSKTSYLDAMHETTHSRSLRLRATPQEEKIASEAWEPMIKANDFGMPAEEAFAVQNELRASLGDIKGNRIYTEKDIPEIKTKLQGLINTGHEYLKRVNIEDFNISALIKSLNKIGLGAVVPVTVGAGAAMLPKEKQGGVTKQHDPLSWFMS